MTQTHHSDTGTPQRKEPTPARAASRSLRSDEPPQWGLTQSIALLWERHRDTNIARLAVLEQAAVVLPEGSLGEDLRQRARDDAQKLAVSAGTFGMLQGSRVAREIAGRSSVFRS